MNRALILVHFDRDGLIDPYVVAAARAYRPIADHFVFVSTSTAEPTHELRDLVDQYVFRENKGYDFGSWREGLRRLGNPARFDEIVFANDSVYGPLFDLAPALANPNTSQADLWGMVLSEHHADHIQSWFFAARAAVLRSNEFSLFWESAGDHLLEKNGIIFRQEIGLSTRIRSAGFRLAGVYDSRSEPLATRSEILRHVSPLSPIRSLKHLRKTRPGRAPFNASELFYERLWKAGVPFIKRRLFHTNYYGLDLECVLSDVHHVSPTWCAMIRDHIRRTS